MRTIAIVLQRTAARQGEPFQPPPTMTAQRQRQLADLATLRLQEMDTAGIDLQALSDIGSVLAPCQGEEEVQLTREANDELARAYAAHPLRFAGFATLPMSLPDIAAEELERAARALGLKGAMIHGMPTGRFLDDGAFLPILERAAALVAPLSLHPAFPPTAAFLLATSGWGWHAEVGAHAGRLILAGIFERMPTLQFIIGHMGEMLPFMLARIDDQFMPLVKSLTQTVSTTVAQRLHLTTSGFFTDPPLLLALQALGADRILVAVDYPFSTNDQGLAILDHAAINLADKEKISHLNAERLLRIELG